MKAAVLQAEFALYFSSNSQMCLDPISSTANARMKVGRDEHVGGSMNQVQSLYVSFLNIISAARQK